MIKCTTGWDDKDIENDTRQFIDLWSGIVLLAEPDEFSIEPDYHKHRRVELFPAIIKIYLDNSYCYDIGIN